MITVEDHHENRVLRPDTWHWDVARPPRNPSWWQQWKRQWACRRSTNHCWHAGSFIDWWCCMCSAERDGMPPHLCTLCTARRGDL